jgi:hypothetical protein
VNLVHGTGVEERSDGQRDIDRFLVEAVRRLFVQLD